MEASERSDDAATPSPSSEPSLAAVLPLKVTGRHYADNLKRVDILFSSMVHFASPELLDEIVIVTPQGETSVAEEYVQNWPELPLRVVGEAAAFSVFQKYRKPWQVRPWQRQQVIKLNSHALTNTDYVLTLDPDVIVRQTLTRADLLPGGRALLQAEPRSVHSRWWCDSAAILGVSPDLAKPGMNVTPAILSRDILLELHARLAEVGRRPWMEVLLTSYCEWTEYSLYLLTAENYSSINEYHEWCHEATRPHGGDAPLLISEKSIWSDEGTAGVGSTSEDQNARIEEMIRTSMSAPGPGFFTVVASSSWISAESVIRAVECSFPVRLTEPPSVPIPPAPSKLRERISTASRLGASFLYRWRRNITA